MIIFWLVGEIIEEREIRIFAKLLLMKIHPYHHI
jgi:hypothetical protein